MVAHGALLRKNFFTAEELAAIVKDFRNAGLAAEEVAIMAFAQKIIKTPSQINEGDFAELRGHGLTDEEILNVILAATARSFFSKTLDTLGVIPDEAYLSLEPELIRLFNARRPFPA